MNAQETKCSDVQLLLPWAVTGRLERDDAVRLEQHLAACPACREELDLERRLAERLSADDNVEYAPSAALQRFMARLDAEGADETPVAADARRAPPPPPGPPARRRRTVGRWLIGVVAAQFAGIAVLGGLLVARSPTSAYVTLSDPAPAARPASLRVVFVSEMTLAELGTLLGGLGAQIEAGPTEAGVFTLSLAPGRPVRPALEALRADRRVRFAEPVTEPRP